MTGTVVKLPPAVRDLDEATEFIQSQSEPERAIRFLREADATLKRLSGMPGIGVIHDSGDPLLADIRVSPVSRHKNFLVFYRPVTEGIVVLRVLHGARDLPSLLDEEFNVREDVGDELWEAKADRRPLAVI